jgi:threonine dehydratase/serine racemase
MDTPHAITLDDVRAAAARIAPFAHRTPVITSATFDTLSGRSLFFKCENLQRVGAFKFRGACNAIARLSDAEARAGVVTHSSGNHAQALALAARIRGIPAYIVMPRTAPAVKRAAVEGYGGRVIVCEPTLADREATAARACAETGAVLIPPYNHPDVMAGQGTAALELLEEIPDLDAVMTPIGGGGLMSGVAVTTRALRPAARIFGAEPENANDAARGKAAGVWQDQAPPKTVADGLMTTLGTLTWPIVRDVVDAVFLVTEAEIIETTKRFWERTKLIIEPSSAVPVAAVLSAAFRAHPLTQGVQRIGIVLSGGNVDLDRLPWLA